MKQIDRKEIIEKLLHRYCRGLETGSIEILNSGVVNTVADQDSPTSYCGARNRGYDLLCNLAKQRETSDKENREKLLKGNADSIFNDLNYLGLDYWRLYHRTLSKEEYESAIIHAFDGKDGILADALVELLKESRRNGFPRESETSYLYLNLLGGYYPKTEQKPEEKLHFSFPRKRELTISEWNDYKRRELNPSRKSFFSRIWDNLRCWTHFEDKKALSI